MVERGGVRVGSLVYLNALWLFLLCYVTAWVVWKRKEEAFQVKTPSLGYN